MMYTVADIMEDIDVGCEERPENIAVLAVVELVSEDGKILRIKIPDQLLYDCDINIGNRVYLDEEGLLQKVFEPEGNKGNRRNIKILVTGFEPFGGNAANPSAIAVGLLPDHIAGADIIKRTLPVVFERAADQLIDFIHDYSPDAVVCTGLAGGRKAITPELIAVNLKNTRIPDNKGQQLVWEEILPGGEDGLFTTLPIREMTEAMVIKEIPAEISRTAGTFVCNEVMYRLLVCRKNEHPGMMAGFIHVPFATEYHSEENNAFSLPIQKIADALEICVREVVKAAYGKEPED